MRAQLVRRVQRFLLFVMVIGVAAALVSAWQGARAGTGPGWLQRLAGPPRNLVGRHIGIVAGHSGYDTGTVCSDGLTEASTNATIAQGVADNLRRRGATVDVLKEFDDRLTGYQADAFISIHADSCEVDLSGFKVAPPDGGSLDSDRLATCLWDSYESATRLARNSDTITADMTSYHAFHQIGQDTPAAIIETGFLKADRRLLTSGHQAAVDGIVNGLVCFLAPPATPTAPIPAE